MSVLGDVLAASTSVVTKSGVSPKPPLLTHTLILGTEVVCICWALRTPMLQGNGQAESSPLLFPVFH